jgi:hypothetical protein
MDGGRDGAHSLFPAAAGDEDGRAVWIGLDGSYGAQERCVALLEQLRLLRQSAISSSARVRKKKRAHEFFGIFSWLSEE